MGIRDRNSPNTSNTPRNISRDEPITAAFLNKIANSLLRLIIGDGKNISVSYVGGKAVISLMGNKIIPKSSTGAGDYVITATTKAGLSSPTSTAYFTRGWVTGETGTNYGPWIWNGTAWVISPVTYTTLSDSARPGDLAIVSGKMYAKITAGSGTSKWSCITHIGPT